MSDIHDRIAVRSPTDFARIIVAIIIGNGFIAYDFTVYSFSAAQIGTLFFPSSNPASSFMLSLATFGAGFAMRPLGALMIGHISDSRGRKAGLTLSLLLMTIGTWTIACLPPYASIGPVATVLIVVARLIQGLASGGEIGPASASLMESVPYRHRCFMVSWRGASQGAAAFAAALVGASCTTLLSPAAMQEWGWRVPFMLGGLIAPVGWYLRRRMPGSAWQQRGKSRSKTMARRMFTEHARALTCGILMMAAPSVSIYVTVFYMPAYLVRTLHRPPAISLWTACLSGFVILVVTPLVARAADRLASRKTLQYVTLTASLLAAWPAFRILTHGAGDMTALAIITAYVALALNNAGAGSVLILEAFPPRRRAAAMAVIYSAGVVAFGGFSPFIVTWLIHVTANPMIPAWYLMTATCVTLVGLNRFPAQPSADHPLQPGSAED